MSEGVQAVLITVAVLVAAGVAAVVWEFISLRRIQSSVRDRECRLLVNTYRAMRVPGDVQ